MTAQLSPRARAFLASEGSHTLGCALNLHYRSLAHIPSRHTKRYAAARAELDAEDVPACDCGLAELRTFHNISRSTP